MFKPIFNSIPTYGHELWVITKDLVRRASAQNSVLMYHNAEYLRIIQELLNIKTDHFCMEKSVYIYFKTARKLF